jgi:DNA-binding transcriptional MerR regulator
MEEAALNKAPDAFRTISEVADELDLPQHVLRFWESRFPHIRPMKRGGGRRYYRPEDIDLLRGIRHLLYGDGYTIRGVQRILREQGVRTVQSVGQGQAAQQLVPPRDDVHETEDEPNGTPAGLKFTSPRDSGISDGLENETEEQDSDGRAPLGPAPQNRPITEVSSITITTVPRLEAAQARRTSVPTAAPSPKGMAAEQLDRLKSVLAELEACRRLLDKAHEGGR